MLAQGLLEGKVMLGLLACPWVVRIVEQPEAVEYVDEDGVPRRHTFDLFVETVDALRFLIEVKPSKIAVRDGIDDHLSVIASYVGRDRADGVALVTELQVPRVVMHDAQLIASSRMHPDPAADERLLAALPAEGATLADLGVATGLKGSAVRAAARLLGAGVLAKSLPQRIGPDLVVVRAGVRGR